MFKHQESFITKDIFSHDYYIVTRHLAFFCNDDPPPLMYRETMYFADDPIIVQCGKIAGP